MKDTYWHITIFLSHISGRFFSVVIVLNKHSGSILDLSLLLFPFCQDIILHKSSALKIFLMLIAGIFLGSLRFMSL